MLYKYCYYPLLSSSSSSLFTRCFTLLWPLNTEQQIMTQLLTFSFPFSTGNRIDINLSQNNLKDNRDKKMPGMELDASKTNAIVAKNMDEDMSDAGTCMPSRQCEGFLLRLVSIVLSCVQKLLSVCAVFLQVTVSVCVRLLCSFNFGELQSSHDHSHTSNTSFTAVVPFKAQNAL